MFFIYYTTDVGDICTTPPSFAKDRHTTVDYVLSEVIQQATRLVGSVAGGAPTIEQAYRSVLRITGAEDTVENKADFLEAVEEIAVAAARACYGDRPVTMSDFSRLKSDYSSALERNLFNNMREAFGSLLCLNSTTATLSKKRSVTVPTDLEDFFNCLGVKDCGPLFGRLYNKTAQEYSVAFAIDDTGSMGDEIEAVKCLVRTFIRAERNYPSKYILGTFNDPGM